MEVDASLELILKSVLSTTTNDFAVYYNSAKYHKKQFEDYKTLQYQRYKFIIYEYAFYDTLHSFILHKFLV